MIRLLVVGCYRDEAMAGLLAHPSNRVDAVAKLVEAVHGRMVSYQWLVGTKDWATVFEVPDAEAAAAIKFAVKSSATLCDMEVHEMIDADSVSRVLTLAAEARVAFAPPGR